MANDDLHDGCDLEFDTPDNTDDVDIDALVLFADIDFLDPAAVAERVAEWEQLADA